MANYEQFENLPSRANTIRGYSVDEVRSVPQKSIRRGLLEEAMLASPRDHRGRRRRLRTRSARGLVRLVLPNCCRPTNAEFESTSASFQRPIRQSITETLRSVTGRRARLLTAMRPLQPQLHGAC